MRARLPTVTPRTYARIALVSLVLLALIVVTGATVRLTGSGLGCPDWPKCYGKVVAPLEFHAVVEYGNRLLTGVIGVAAVAAGLLAWRRRPFRRDLALIGALLPLGVAAQAVLGGLTVRNHLAPEFVMGHYALSMVLLDASVALAWRARHEVGARPRSHDRSGVWATRGLLGLGALTILVGTAATASGPHAGGAGTGDTIPRLEWRGADTLSWMVHQHGRLAALFGVLVLALWLRNRARGVPADRQRPLTLLLVLLALQGVVGLTQYALELPAELVWLHVVLAVLAQLCLLWAVAAAGQLVPRAAVPAPIGAHSPGRDRMAVGA